MDIDILKRRFMVLFGDYVKCLEDLTYFKEKQLLTLILLH